MSNATIAELTQQSAEAAVQIAKRTTAGLRVVDATDALVYDPDPWVYPTAVDDGFDVSGTTAAMLRVCLAENPIARTSYLVINPATAPLTGAYVTVVDGTTVTYNASAEADVDALLTEWRDAIWAAQGIGSGDVTFSAVEVTSFRANGVNDAIRLVGLTSANPARSTYALQIGTVAPALADLHVFAELDEVAALVLVRSAATPPAGGDSAGTLRQRQGWTMPSDGVLTGGEIGSSGVVTYRGWADGLDVGGLDRLAVVLSAPDYGADTLATTTGITLVPLVTVSVEPASA